MGRRLGRPSERRARDTPPVPRPRRRPRCRAQRPASRSPSRSRSRRRGAGRGGAGRGGPAPRRFPFFFTLKATGAFPYSHRSRARQPARLQEPGSRRWRRGRGEEAASLPAAGASSAPESGRRRRPPRNGRQGQARGLGGWMGGRAGCARGSHWGTEWAPGRGAGQWGPGRVPAGDPVGVSGEPFSRRGSQERGPGRRPAPLPPLSPQARAGRAAPGPTWGDETGRESLRPRRPSHPGLSLGGCRPRKGLGTRGGPRRLVGAGTRGGLRSRDHPCGRGRGQRDPAPRSYFRFSRHPGSQRSPTSPLGAPQLCPQRLPRGAHRATPRAVPPSPPPRSRRGFSRPPRDSRRVRSGNRLKRKNRSSLGPSAVIVLFKFKAKAPRNAHGPGGAVAWSAGRDCELCV